MTTSINSATLVSKRIFKVVLQFAKYASSEKVPEKTKVLFIEADWEKDVRLLIQHTQPAAKIISMYTLM